MKTIKYILSIALFSSLCLGISGCSEKEELSADNDKGIEIKGIALGMVGRVSETGTNTKAPEILKGFSVNTIADPTFKGLSDRASWKMDFTLYYGTPEAEYLPGSFTSATYTVVDNIGTLTPTSQCYFPNYVKPNAEAFLYPDSWVLATSTPAFDQSKTGGDDLLAQDVLKRAKSKIEVSHNPEIIFSHKHAMLDFVIKDVVISDISEVKVIVGDQEYTPYKVKDVTGTSDVEYLVILPEITSTSPIVQIKTSTGTGINPITYRQNINIISGDKTELGSNKCYCFILQGEQLKISPVTVLNWATGASIPGEYIAVTAYPTFIGLANRTYYFYYDNKLIEKDKDGKSKPKLQEIKFNENAECTIKPDGRIITHIFKDTEVEAIAESANENMTPKPDANGALTPNIILGAMIIDVTEAIKAIDTP